jgi:glycosyltransferase involved in cell wall biosynthesis
MVYPATLISFIKKSGCQIVHTHSGCWAKVAVACAYLSNMRLVYTEHGRTFPDPQLQIYLDRMAGKFTDRIVAVGEPLREYLINTVKLPARKVITIKNGIDTARFGPSAETRAAVRNEFGYGTGDVVIAIVARLAPVKNHKLLIDTFGTFAGKYPQARLLIIGDGPLRGELESHVAHCSLQQKITFAGDRPDVERLMTGADIATLSSQSEGISLTLLEAMATGLPVVATNVGGNPTIITEGRDGHLVEQNVPSYSTALGRLVESETVRRQLGERARTTVIEKWSVTRMAEQYQELYAELVT